MLRSLILPALVAHCLSVANAQAFDWKGQLATRVLKTSLSSRCSNFIRVNPDQRGRLGSICSDLSDALVEALDSERNEKSRGLLFVSHDTRRILRHPRTADLLKRLRTDLEDYRSLPVRRSAFPLFRSCVEAYGSVDLAADAMATLFQDNSYSPDRPDRPLHLILIREKAPAWGIRETVVNDLEEILKMIRTNDPESVLTEVEAYPEPVESLKSNFNDKLYYYYLPRILTRHLVHLGKSMEQKNPGDSHLVPRVIRALPTLMSLIYKQAHGRNSYLKTVLLPLKPTARQTQNGTLVVEPGWEYRYRDLYMAYIGTLDALGRKDPYGFERFRKTLALNPGELIGLISK